MKRNFGKKVAFGFSMFSFAGSLVSIALFAYIYPLRGAADPIVASMLAIIFFLASCGVVLYFISKPPRYELQPWDNDL